jgi:hypothetical protein
MKSITLKNKSKFPIVIEAWQTVTYNLSELESKVVKPGEKTTIKSEDGEWFIQTYLQTDEWRAAKYIPGQTIGKIREEPIIKEQNGKPGSSSSSEGDNDGKGRKNEIEMP